MLLPEPARDSPVAGLCRPAGRNAALYAAMGFFPAQQPPSVFKIAQDVLQNGSRSICPFLKSSDHTRTKFASAKDDVSDPKAGSSDLHGRLDSLVLGEQTY